MLNGIYGYIFGGEESNDSTTSTNSATSSGSDENEEPQTQKYQKYGKICEDDWFLINDENANVDRFSPVLIARPDIRDIDELSFASSRQAPDTPSQEELRKAEELKLAKARNAQRAHLEKVMFEDMSLSTLASGSFQKSTSSKSFKKTCHNSDTGKGKSRSKKSSGKTSSGRNNDRKVNNID